MAKHKGKKAGLKMRGDGHDKSHKMPGGKVGGKRAK